jgi:hypothetical protein
MTWTLCACPSPASRACRSRLGDDLGQGGRLVAPEPLPTSSCGLQLISHLLSGVRGQLVFRRGSSGAVFARGASWPLSPNCPSAPPSHHVRRPAFEKNFYLEHPAVSARSSEEVETFRHAEQIHVYGEGVPKPVTTFEEASFPDYVLAEVMRAGFKRPTAIQCQGWPMVRRGRASPPLTSCRGPHSSPPLSRPLRHSSRSSVPAHQPCCWLDLPCRRSWAAT